MMEATGRGGAHAAGSGEGTEVLTSFEKGLGCDEERAREPRFLARLQRGDRITGQDRRRGAGVWVRLHRACLPHLVFFQNKGDT